MSAMYFKSWAEELADLSLNRIPDVDSTDGGKVLAASPFGVLVFFDGDDSYGYRRCGLLNRSPELVPADSDATGIFRLEAFLQRMSWEPATDASPEAALERLQAEEAHDCMYNSRIAVVTDRASLASYWFQYLEHEDDGGSAADFGLILANGSKVLVGWNFE